MKKLFITLVLTLSTVQLSFAAEGNAEAGKTKSAMCAACHGVDGNSLVPMYPSLAGQNTAYIAKQLADFKKAMATGGKEGRVDPVMGGMTMALSEQDMLDLGAYFNAQTPKASTGKSNEKGHSLYFGGNAEFGITACVACHGADGKGMSQAGFPSLAGQSATYIKSQLEKFRAGTRANDNNGMMRNTVIEMTDEDIMALSDYITSLK